jgi:anti-sigma B factor antagonist
VAVEFEIAEEEAGAGTRIVAVRGEIDLFSAPEFKEALRRAIDARPRRLVLDLTATTFVDSSSLGVLIGASKRLTRGDGTLVIACDNRTVLNTFTITGLTSLFTIVGSRDEALDSGPVGAG